MSVRHAMLALLSEGPNFGLKLQQDFEVTTGEVWPLNVGQVYATLQRLERDGLIELKSTDAAGRQSIFQITQAGEAELKAWLRTPSDMEPPPRDELIIKVLVALRVPELDVHDVIQAHRRVLIEAMQRYTRIKAGALDDEIEISLVVDAQIFRLESVVRWLDAADIRIRRR
jgi:DNA-binding PadR family transcriptional regulator